MTGASLLTRYDVAISRSRNETGTGSWSESPYPLGVKRASCFFCCAYASIAPTPGRMPNWPDGALYGWSSTTTPTSCVFGNPPKSWNP